MAFQAKSESTLASSSPAPNHRARSPRIFTTWSARSQVRSSPLAHPCPNATSAIESPVMCGTPPLVRRIVAS
jgi:hypothetical protein